MKSKILNGNEIIIGGIIIMPIDIKMLEIIISTIIKGMKRKKPMINPARISLKTKAGIKIYVDTSFLFFGFA
jgi:hypothetical protein